MAQDEMTSAMALEDGMPDAQRLPKHCLLGSIPMGAFYEQSISFCTILLHGGL
jgi:hypothetical protein